MYFKFHACINFPTDMLLKILDKKEFSDPGTLKYTKEQTAYVYFTDLLEQVERK